MEFDLDQAIAVLSRTPETLQALLKDLPRDWVENNEGPETWSPYDVVGHLIQADRANWIPRAQTILRHGESRAFDAFDRFAMFSASQGKTLEELIAQFAALRKQNLKTLREMKIGPAELEKAGRHPQQGRLTLKELLATWVAHDLDHIAQIVRTMAKQYTSQVGPMKDFLSVVTDRDN